MIDALKPLFLLILTEECYVEFFEKFNFFHVPCLKIALSKSLGYAIIAGSLFVKVPQVLKILQNKSAEGLSITSILMELFAITANCAYMFNKGFPFSAWGEGLFLIIQTAAVAALTFFYGFSSQKAAAFLATYVALLSVLMGGFTPMDILWAMQAFNVPVIVVGKMLQAIANYKNGSTGQLSAVTAFMLLFGSMARIFTSVQETGDMIVIITYVSASSVNFIIAAQLLYYWNVPPPSERRKKQQKQKKRQ